MNIELLLLIEKHTHTLIEQKKLIRKKRLNLK